jgi:hypothetical protein
MRKPRHGGASLHEGVSGLVAFEGRGNKNGNN